MVATDTLAGLRALADSTRLALARLLIEGPFNVGELQEVFGLGQSTVSHHLKILVDAGLLSCRREGRLAYYQWETSLAPPLEALQAFVGNHAPALDGDARRRLHQVFEARAERTRRFFDSPRADCVGTNVIDPIATLVPLRAIVADLGTGAGRLLGSLRTRASRVIGIDASPRMLERATRLARDEGWDDVELRLGTLEHLPLRDGEVDVAVAHQVLHHAARPEIALAEAQRALKPGGRLIVGDFLPHDQEWMREELADQWLGFEPGAFRRLLQKAGFEYVEITKYEGQHGTLGMFVASARRPVEQTTQLKPLASQRVRRTPPEKRNTVARATARGARS